MSTLRVDSIQGVSGNPIDLDVSSLNDGPLAGFRNQIINGDFRVWQRGDGPIQSTVNFEFGPDRWRNFSNANNQLNKLNTKATTPVGFDYACRVDNTAGAGYSNALGIVQPIELARVGGRGEPFTKGSTWIFSCVSTAPSLNLDVFFGSDSLTMTDSIVANQAMTQSAYGGGWFTYTYEVTFPNSDPDATATCLVIRPRTSGQSSWDITGCQFEPGSVATPFEHRPIGTELALCQRYYQASDQPVTLSPRVSGSTTSRAGQIYFRVTMRTTPTFTTTVLGINDVSAFANPDFINFRSTSTSTGAESSIRSFTADAEL